LLIAVVGATAAAVHVNVAADQPASLSNRFDPGLQVAVLGAQDAPILVVEFLDYRCGFCARQARAAFDQLLARYIEPGLVRYIAVEVPLLGAEAERDAEVARCAGEQGGYWRVHRALLIDAVFPREGPLALDALAKATGLDLTSLSACVETGRQLEPLRDGAALAAAHRVDATPTYFFGYPADGQNAMTVERHLVGATGVAPVIEAIEALLNSLRDRQLRIRTDR
jgi:protein-disulfide isomerase